MADAHRDTPKIGALTTLRFFAAFMVLMVHFEFFTGGALGIGSNVSLLQGVSFFFVLSGFILAYVYPDLGAGDRRRFVGARIARIWPLHLVALLGFVIVAMVRYGHMASGIGGLFLNMFLLHAWVPDPGVHGSFNGPSFSLSIELFFYVLFPLLIIGRRWWAWAIKFAVAGGLVVLMIWLADERLADLPKTWDAVGLVYHHPLARLWEFVLGMGAAQVWRALRGRVRLRPLVATGAEAAALGLVIANLWWAQSWARSITGGAGARNWLFDAGLPSITFALLLVVFGLERGALSRALSWSPLVFLGEISYSTYLLHILVLLPVAMRRDVFLEFGPVALFAGFVAVMIVVSWLSWAVIEVPARAAFLRIWNRSDARSRGAAVRTGLPRWPRLVWAGVGAAAVALCAVSVMPIRTAARAPDAEGLTRFSGLAFGGLSGVGAVPANPTGLVVSKSQFSGDVLVFGWAADTRLHQAIRGAFVRMDGGKRYWLPGGGERLDVLDRFDGDPRKRYSGFVGTIPADDLAVGKHRVTIEAVPHRSAGYLPVEGTVMVVEP